MNDSIDPVIDYGARIRAARGFAHITQEELAKQLGVEVQTIKRRELPPDHERAQQPKRGERLAISQICGVPPEFLEHGFGGVADSEISQKLRELEEAVRDVQRELLVSERAASQRTADSDRQAPGSQPGPPR